ncbi:MAG: hypothetical protein KME30_12065 [Iphinoe sp. HA4291-MV1]|nr:hypothetical protein [Iphinoe sp. HA4291-MV1]
MSDRPWLLNYIHSFMSDRPWLLYTLTHERSPLLPVIRRLRIPETLIGLKIMG